MNAVVIEHVKASELPEEWRARLSIGEGARVTVRIEEEVPAGEAAQGTRDTAFGMWADRADVADVEAYLRSLRAGRYP
jgi:hypothetical protein